MVKRERVLILDLAGKNEVRKAHLYPVAAVHPEMKIEVMRESKYLKVSQNKEWIQEEGGETSVDWILKKKSLSPLLKLSTWNGHLHSPQRSASSSYLSSYQLFIPIFSKESQRYVDGLVEWSALID